MYLLLLIRAAVWRRPADVIVGGVRAAFEGHLAGRAAQIDAAVQQLQYETELSLQRAEMEKAGAGAELARITALVQSFSDNIARVRNAGKEGFLWLQMHIGGVRRTEAAANVARNRSEIGAVFEFLDTTIPYTSVQEHRSFNNSQSFAW